MVSPAGEVVASANLGVDEDLWMPVFHVCLVVVAHVHHIMASFHGSRKRLKTYVICASVSPEGYELKGVLYFSTLFKHSVGRFHACRSSRRVFKGAVYVAVVVGCVRIYNVETSRQLVALVITALSSGFKALSTPLTAIPAPHPAQSLWPPASLSGFSTSFFRLYAISCFSYSSYSRWSTVRLRLSPTRPSGLAAVHFALRIAPLFGQKGNPPTAVSPILRIPGGRPFASGSLRLAPQGSPLSILPCESLRSSAKGQPANGGFSYSSYSRWSKPPSP